MEKLKFIIDEIESNKISLDEAKVEFIEAYMFGFVSDDELAMAEEIGFIKRNESNYIFKELYEMTYSKSLISELEESQSIKEKLKLLSKKAKKFKADENDINELAKEEIEEDKILEKEDC